MTTLIHFLGAVALVLWGLRMVRKGIMRAYGPWLGQSLGRTLNNRWAALTAGLGVTLLLQSSQATSLLVAGFAARQVISGGAALAVMLGADIGTALVAQAYSFRIDWISPALIFVGWLMFTKIQQAKGHDLGRAIVGLGLVLLGLHLIGAVAAPLAQSPDIAEILTIFAAAPLSGILLGAALTAAAASSLAIILLVASLMQTGILPLPLGLMMVLGANLGSAILPILANASAPPEQRRIPIGNGAFRLIGCVIFAGVLPALLPYLSVIHAEPWRQALDFHVLFNVTLAALFIFFVHGSARLLERFWPTVTSDGEPGRPRYLGPATTPSVALANAAREVLRLGDLVGDMLRKSLQVFRSDDRKLIGRVSELDNHVDRLNREIKLYLSQVALKSEDRIEQMRIHNLILLTTNLEHIGDIVDKGLMALAAKKLKYHLQFSPEGASELVAIHERLTHNLDLALNVFVSGDKQLARQLYAEKKVFRDMERQAAAHHLERLRSGRTDTIQTSALHLDILRDLKRINGHLTALVQPILENAGELHPSRLKAESIDNNKNIV
ncbi:MAG TPA: Na/Pi cotransporter family protein [Dongiaceae bacterium]|nr:Na/Pi cotransporter family protein [Dongiaceae bacterium]